jgi:circadian clock protein KaiB
MADPKSTDTKEVEAVIRERSSTCYVLRLYVSGLTPRSQRAIDNLKAICEEHLQGRYDLEVVDIFQQPEFAKAEQIIAAPTLVKELPLPLRKFIGDMSQTEKILLGLEIRPENPAKH